MWVTDFDSDFIEIPVVYTVSYCFICFPNEYNRTDPRTNAGFDNAIL